MKYDIDADNSIRLPALPEWLSQPELVTPDNVVVLQTTIGDRGTAHLEQITQQKPYNLALHVKDNPSKVLQRRALLLATLQYQYPTIKQIVWVNQVHGRIVQPITETVDGLLTDADAILTVRTGVALAIMTADCVPVVVFSRQSGAPVAAIHAGWRGLVQGVIASTVKSFATMQSGGDRLQTQAWIGPCISMAQYRVRATVVKQLSESIAKDLSYPTAKDTAHILQWYDRQQANINLREIARLQLIRAGIPAEHIKTDTRCSYVQPELYSHRQSAHSGRMATLIAKF